MKVIRLKSENVMKLVAVDITPQGNLVIVGGKNGAGKSSVLNSIAMALGGENLAPSEPIRAGETDAKIEVDLGDFIVTRKFSRDKIVVPAKVLSGQPGDYVPEQTTWGETKSTLVVTNKDGARYPSPQAMLNKILGRLTFDPLAFAREGESTEGQKKQADTLRKLVGIDVSALNAKRDVLVTERRLLKQTHGIKEAQLLALPFYKDAPAVEISLDEISKEMLEAEQLRKKAEDAERQVSLVREQHASELRAVDTYVTEIIKLETQIANLTDRRREAEERTSKLFQSLNDAQTVAMGVRASVPDVALLRQKLSETEVKNNLVRANTRYTTLDAEVKQLSAKVQDKDTEVQKVDGDKKYLLAEAKFPVPGLGLSDDGVTFNGLPFSQAASSEQLRVSVAIGLALNPTLKVLLIRSGNLLDDDSLQLVAEQAEKADAQVWMEYVTSNPEGVQVMIEEGHVATEKEVATS